MTDRTDGGRSVGGSFKPRRFTVENRVRAAVICLFVVLAIVAGGHIYGRFLANRELGGRDIAIEQLQTQAQSLKRLVDQKSAQITAMETKMMNAEAALEAIMPAKNTYAINPNQSVIVADGHLKIGLVGSPANEGVTLIINGKQQQLAAGQVLNVTSDTQANCQVTVQSFDMFQAMVNATCAGGKPQ